MPRKHNEVCPECSLELVLVQDESDVNVVAVDRNGGGEHELVAYFSADGKFVPTQISDEVAERAGLKKSGAGTVTVVRS
jgi:hypothetical protein